VGSPYNIAFPLLLCSFLLLCVTILYNNMLRVSERERYYTSGSIQRVEVTNPYNTSEMVDAFAFADASETELAKIAENLIGLSRRTKSMLKNSAKSDRIEMEPLDLQELQQHFTSAFHAPDSPTTQQSQQSDSETSTRPLPPKNLVIFLPGSGETSPNNNYFTLGKKFDLPSTAILSILPPQQLPFDLGYAWFTEMDYTTGLQLSRSDPVRLETLRGAVSKMRRLLKFITSRSFARENVFLFGFSSGATVAMEVAKEEGRSRIGGCVCVCGGCVLEGGVDLEDERGDRQEKRENGGKGIYISSPHDPNQLNTTSWTPILLLAGKKDKQFTQRDAKRSASLYLRRTDVDIRMMGGGHSMIKSEGEIRAVMKFLGKHLTLATPAMDNMFKNNK